MQSVEKVLLRFFSSSLPSLAVYFHIVMPRDVLSACYARYQHTKAYAAYTSASYVRLQVENIPYYPGYNYETWLGVT
jgi:hypothetical protein